jgi:hypothetical protein
MTDFDPEGIPEDEGIDNSVPHPTPDELNLLCLDDPDLVQKLDQRWADDGPTIPWSELRRESF